MYNHHIDTFLSVTRFGSFSKAALELNLTPTAVSKHIDDLENILERKLLVRGAHGVQLTEYGMRFINESNAIKKLSEEVIEKIRYSGQERETPITIGSHLFAPMSEFNKICLSSSKLAGFKTSVIEYNPNTNDDNSSANRPEIVFGMEESVNKDPEADFLPLTTQKLTCMVPVSHRLARKEKITYGDLAGEELYFPSRGNPCTAYKVSNYVYRKYPNIIIHTLPIYYDMEVINRCAGEDKILIGFERLSRIHPRLINLPVKWNWKVALGVIWRKDARKVVLDFMEAFKEASSTIR